MHLSAVTALALPLLAAAQQGPFDQYIAQAQQVFGSFAAKIPNPNKFDPVGAAAAKVGDMKMHVLTLDNFKETLYSPVKATSTGPEEWWVLVTGGNKTCMGECGQIDLAFNQTAAKFAVLPKAPHVGMINCDLQPVLCNAMSAATGFLWILEMVPPPGPVDIYTKRLNLTTTTSETLMDLYKTSADKSTMHKYEGSYFHPFDGQLAQYGLAVPIGYLFWALNVVPSWMVMLAVSMGSRTMMGRNRGRPAAGAPGAAPAAAN